MSSMAAAAAAAVWWEGLVWPGADQTKVRSLTQFFFPVCIFKVPPRGGAGNQILGGPLVGETLFSSVPPATP